MTEKDFKRNATNLLMRLVRAGILKKDKSFQLRVKVLAKLLSDTYSKGYNEGHEEQMKMRIRDEQDRQLKSSYRILC